MNRITEAILKGMAEHIYSEIPKRTYQTSWAPITTHSVDRISMETIFNYLVTAYERGFDDGYGEGSSHKVDFLRGLGDWK